MEELYVVLIGWIMAMTVELSVVALLVWRVNKTKE
jgi:hypothetical protein